jgi:hypothetical protein
MRNLEAACNQKQYVPTQDIALMDNFFDAIHQAITGHCLDGITLKLANAHKRILFETKSCGFQNKCPGLTYGSKRILDTCFLQRITANKNVMLQKLWTEICSMFPCVRAVLILPQKTSQKRTYLFPSLNNGRNKQQKMDEGCDEAEVRLQMYKPCFPQEVCWLKSGLQTR